ncbi:TetR/AcrR family transcriptional regulator [Sphingobium sp. CR2-8]|uniref:TetR/AcrR family transcriptional regulator n=1 Tax=Sphingobium sp. CR2-8 TaxID=1306534 RepID=UPI002DBB9CD0|nr:TetR/AcrR family transcriptional regulator [Sphingobium sp. CR2-8]MEC3909087.1 TetR/AcrR family transcriptional regulator [Sphingobium sp. CR2-8]
MGDESTPDRILSTALKLFNSSGVDRVPIYKIASSLSISPGNLTYHFAKKQDIIYALIDRLEHDATDVLSSPRNPSAKHLAEYIVNLFSLMWRYHFFFESLTYFTATDPHLAESYHRIMTTAITGSIQRIKDAISCGDIAPLISPNSPQILGENMWAVWVNRLGAARSGFNEQRDGIDAIYDCCIHHMSLIQPYASETYIFRLHNAIKEMLNIDQRPKIMNS